ncbi:LeuD/DmdB family oxidoreductase small subunit [Anaeromicropila populeti]|uniref:3-isopropylmalate/(R)-2-methylmalate dehydratase small subunit n=1 Tax=Anaeromicropila populeti TaxID=37658 RepID=A0A1I6HSB2_9FIRM|nr:3-isopropylmalate dehydratase small subunit [Anaeromicropila populeti]SFR57352.1 3-isopropylmalate/(R)-2-methylmalate dehydratase small subunit [Anaeromicropila populeti]
MKDHIIKVGNDIDTDQIIASQYLLLNIEEMAKHTFETLIENFPETKNGSIIVAGENFGCGSSREQAPRVLKQLGIQLVVASSFARIFFRNAINVGLPVVVCKGIYKNIQDNDFLEADIEDGILTVNNQEYKCTKLPDHMANILKAGGLIEFLNQGGAGTWE